MPRTSQATRWRSAAAWRWSKADALAPVPVGVALLPEGLAGLGRVLEAEQPGGVVLLHAVAVLQRHELRAVHGLLRQPQRDRTLLRQLGRQRARRGHELIGRHNLL